MIIEKEEFFELARDMAAQGGETGNMLVHFLEQSWGVVEDVTSPEFHADMAALLVNLKQGIIAK